MNLLLNQTFSLDRVYSSVISFCIISYYFLLMFLSHERTIWTVGILVILTFYVTFIQQKFILNLESKYWLLFILISVTSMLLTQNFNSASILFCVTLVVMYLTYSIVSSSSYYLKYTYLFLNLTSIFFVIGSIIQIINPNLLLTINKMHMTPINYEQSFSYIYREILSGFFNQIGTNGFALSVALSFTFVNFFKTKKKFMKIFTFIFMILLLYLIFMTGKRGFIIFNIFIILFLIPFITKVKVIVPVLISLFLLLVGYVLFNSDIGTSILMRFQEEDISSGRFSLNTDMFNDFLKSPIWGWGTYTTKQSLGQDIDGHNIYLQVLRENGLLGFIPFISFLTINLTKNFKALTNISKESKYYYIVIFAMYNQFLFLLWGLTGNSLYDTFAIFIYFIAISYVAYIDRNLETNKLKGDLKYEKS